MHSQSATGSPSLPRERLPTRLQAAVFFGKTWSLRLLHFCGEVARGRPRRFRPESTPIGTPMLAESRGLLYGSGLAAEFALQAGKVQNLRLAAARLQSLIVPPREVFSFWAHVPRPTRRRGYAAGRELREGCVIPSVGGGLCQLSNALYDAALRAGFEIVERHAHSRRLPGSMAEAGRDATVFWNYVDLRFRPPEGCQIEVFLTREELVVRFRALQKLSVAPRLPTTMPSFATLASPLTVALAESCDTCGMTTCFRHPGQELATHHGKTACLVDTWWPEFDRYITENRTAADSLLLPLNGRRFRLRSYPWKTVGFRHVRQAPLETLRRSWSSRRLATQGAARQRALLRFDAALAARYARLIPVEATHLVVAQNLLPFLWCAGVLGGRTYDVLMTRLPISVLQSTLDRAAALHPESSTLADFRADPALAEAEDAALAEASHWITPHSTVAKLAGTRAVQLPWHVPTTNGQQFRPPPADAPFTVLFPASTLGRKGAYELRAAARERGWHVRLGGPILEDANFWEDVPTTLANGPRDWNGIHAVVLPAWVESQPRRLLSALAAGVPVLASPACGLEGLAGITGVPAGNWRALETAVTRTAPALADIKP